MADIQSFARLSSKIQINIIYDFHTEYIQQRYHIKHRHERPKNQEDLLKAIPAPANYITDIGLETLQTLAGIDGVLITKDIGAYIYRARKRIGYSLRDASEHLSLTHAGVYKLERSHGDRITFADIVRLDDALNTQGELISFAWLVFKSHDQILQCKKDQGKDSRYINIVEGLITVSRLYQCFLPGEIFWPVALRQKIHSYFPHANKE